MYSKPSKLKCRVKERGKTIWIEEIMRFLSYVPTYWCHRHLQSTQIESRHEAATKFKNMTNGNNFGVPLFPFKQ